MKDKSDERVIKQVLKRANRVLTETIADAEMNNADQPPVELIVLEEPQAATPHRPTHLRVAPR